MASAWFCEGKSSLNIPNTATINLKILSWLMSNASWIIMGDLSYGTSHKQQHYLFVAALSKCTRRRTQVFHSKRLRLRDNIKMWFLSCGTVWGQQTLIKINSCCNGGLCDPCELFYYSDCPVNFIYCANTRHTLQTNIVTKRLCWPNNIVLMMFSPTLKSVLEIYNILQQYSTPLPTGLFILKTTILKIGFSLKIGI